MHKARHILAVTLVATALCADRALAAAPLSHRGEVGVMSMAGRLVSRLSSNFRRVVPTMRLYQPRTQQHAPAFETPVSHEQVFVPPQLSLLHFRLPPPIL